MMRGLYVATQQRHEGVGYGSSLQYESYYLDLYSCTTTTSYLLRPSQHD